MKKLSLILGVILFCLNPTYNQTYTISELNALLENPDANTKLTIERIAAMEFHKIINQYRAENGRSPLIWDETLWLAARNHSVYMALNNICTHTEANVSDGFTGRNPGDRYIYAAEGKPEFTETGIGENAIINSSGFGNDVEERGIDIAKKSFDIWRLSPGHNENMLDSDYKKHGTAFIIYGSIYGTDLFSNCVKSGEMEEVVTQKQKKQSLYNTQRVISNNVLAQLLNSLTNKPKQNNKMNDEAK
jgi:hypothetical protein